MERGDIHSEEATLIDRILQGEKHAYRVLVERYSPMVFRLVRSYVRREETVRELAQEIFVRAYEKLARFDRNSSFSTWLYAIGRNRCLDHLKDHRRKQIPFSELDPERLEPEMADGDDPYRRLAADERMRRLAEAIGRLGPEQAEPLLMKYRDGCSYEAISQKLGVSVSALKVRVHRARKELKSQLEGLDREV